MFTAAKDSVSELQAAQKGAQDRMSTKKWYVIQAYAGQETSVKASLEERIRQAGLEALFGEILIPKETVQVQPKASDNEDGLPPKRSKPRNVTRNFFPGYMFISMEMNENTWHLVKDTPKINGFIGGRHPTPVPEQEIGVISQQVVDGQRKPKVKVSFEVGESVRVVKMNYVGQVLEVDNTKQKLKVMVSIFGRPTPVDLDFADVEKMA